MRTDAYEELVDFWLYADLAMCSIGAANGLTFHLMHGEHAPRKVTNWPICLRIMERAQAGKHVKAAVILLRISIVQSVQCQ
jgi:hypothetical protein